MYKRSFRFVACAFALMLVLNLCPASVYAATVSDGNNQSVSTVSDGNNQGISTVSEEEVTLNTKTQEWEVTTSAQLAELCTTTNYTNVELKLNDASETIDLSPLANLTYLESLKFNGFKENKISNAEKLGELTKLNNLQFVGTFTPATMLAGFEGKETQLVTLQLNNTSDTDVALGGVDLSAYTNVTWLWIKNFTFDSLADAGILEMGHLRTLYVRECGLSDVSGAKNKLSTLNAAYLEGNELSDVSELGEISSLHSLSLAGNNLTKEHVVATFPDRVSNLEWLYYNCLGGYVDGVTYYKAMTSEELLALLNYGASSNMKVSASQTYEITSEVYDLLSKMYFIDEATGSTISTVEFSDELKPDFSTLENGVLTVDKTFVYAEQVVRNDDTGIPDDVLYAFLLDWFDTNSDGVLTVDEIETQSYLDLHNEYNDYDWDNVTDFTGLSTYMPNLQMMHLDYYYEGNPEMAAFLEVADEFPDLIYVSGWINSQAELDALCALDSVTNLSLYGWGFDADVSALYNKKEMNSIDIYNYTDKIISMDLSKLPADSELSGLTLRGTNADINALPASLKGQLYDLAIELNGSESEVDFSSFVNLAYLDVYVYNTPKKLKGIEALSDLYGLEALSNGIEGTTIEGKLPAPLHHLYVSNITMNDLKTLGITEMKELYTLSLNNCDVRDISGIKNLADLEYLYLAYNKISDASELTHLSELYRIDLTGNKLTALPDLTKNKLVNSGLNLSEQLNCLRIGGNELTKEAIVGKVPAIFTNSKSWMLSALSKSIRIENNHGGYTIEAYDISTAQEFEDILSSLRFSSMNLTTNSTFTISQAAHDYLKSLPQPIFLEYYDVQSARWTGWIRIGSANYTPAVGSTITMNWNQNPDRADEIRAMADPSGTKEVYLYAVSETDAQLVWNKLLYVPASKTFTEFFYDYNTGAFERLRVKHAYTHDTNPAITASNFRISGSEYTKLPEYSCSVGEGVYVYVEGNVESIDGSGYDDGDDDDDDDDDTPVTTPAPEVTATPAPTKAPAATAAPTVTQAPVATPAPIGQKDVPKVLDNVPVVAPEAVQSALVDTMAKVIKNAEVVASAPVTLTKDIFNTMLEQEKNITVNVVNENNELQYGWTFESDGLIPDNFADVDLTVNFETEKQKEIEELTGQTDAFYMSFNYHGELPAPATMQVYVGDKYANGDVVYLYYYNEETKEIESINGAKGLTIENGYVTYTITHCSEYFLAAATPEEMGIVVEEVVEDTPAKEETTETKPEAVQDAVPPVVDATVAATAEGGFAPVLIVALVVAVIAIAVAAFVIMRKREN